MRRIYLLWFIAPLCCSKPAARSELPANSLRSGTTDSIVLERTRCLGGCPAYRLRVSRAGEVAFVSQYPDRRTVIDTVSNWVADSVSDEAARLGFFSLPDSVVPGTWFCREMITDVPTIAVGVFGSRTKRVRYYLGCRTNTDSSMMQRLRNLSHIAARIDSLTRSDRWIRPGGRR